MNLDAALQTFFSESYEQLESMESHLLQLEVGNAEDIGESLNAIFRAAHTIKGSAGMFNLVSIVGFTHVVENLLNRLREAPTLLNMPLLSVLLQCRDHIETLVREAEQGIDANAETEARSQQLMLAIDQVMKGEPSAEPCRTGPRSSSASAAVARYVQHMTQEEGDTDAATNRFERLSDPDLEHDHWHILIRFGDDVLRDGMDPLSFISYLATLGTLVSVTPLSDRLPRSDAFDPESCYLGFEIQMDSNRSKQEIEDVFEFVRDSSELHILPPYSALSDYIAVIEAMPNIDLKLGEILLECGALTQSELEAALARQADRLAHDQSTPIGEILTESNTQLSPVLEAAVRKQASVRESGQREQKSLRVDADKLDLLINRVGELVTAGAGTALQAEQSGNGDMIESVSVLNALLEEVRDAALKLRMVPIGSTFNRFQRVVRDLCQELDKDVRLTLHGADTELDKSVVEKISDPLMHLVRNAMDHGIESASERSRLGKPEEGQLSLNAFHDSGHIVIEVIDDGKGLDPDKIFQRAVEKELVDPDTVLNRDDILNLIFEPGFSTAEVVSNLSGRGVGMDVVKRNITDLRGRIDLCSEVNVGTRLRIMLPLTLAIIDGFLIGVGDDVFVVPLDQVRECVEYHPSLLTGDNKGRAKYINLRGKVLPLIDLFEHFELSGRPARRQSIVVVRSGDRETGLVVDRLMGEFQTVIKPLGQLFERVGGLSGSTILGSGAVALILDIQGLMHHYVQQENRHSVQTG